MVGMYQDKPAKPEVTWREIACDLCLKPTGIKQLHLKTTPDICLLSNTPTICSLCYKVERREVERQFLCKHEQQQERLREMLELLNTEIRNSREL